MARSRTSNALKLDPFKLAGSRLGSYQLVELIGAGGMGAVYHARHDLNPEVRVALKILRPDLAYSYPEMSKDFLDEARRTSRLDHPGIIRVLYMDIDREQQLPFFVMEWLDGRTLEEELEARGRMPPERVAGLLEQVSSAISYAHQRGLVHRDLKPGNIMLVTDDHGRERVKVLDFGIAKAVDSTHGATISRVMGAPYYASPEQLNLGAKIDRRSDIYSLGVTVYQLLTCSRPFDSDSISVVINQHLNQAPPPLRDILPEISVAVERVVLRALMKRPEDRYADADEFARAFRQAAGMEAGSLSLSVTDARAGGGVAGASVYLDGGYAGRADSEGQFNADGLNPDEHLLRVEAHRYLRREGLVKVGPNSKAQVVWELEPQSAGELALKTNVARAEVFVNGELKGLSDSAGALNLRDVPSGALTVEVRRRRYKPYAGEVRVQAGEPASLEVELEEVPRRWPSAYLIVGIAAAVCVALGGASLYAFSGDGEAATFAASLSAGSRARSAAEKARDGDARLKAGDFERAEAAFRAAVNVEPLNPEYHRLLGEALLKQTKREEEAARAFYEAALLKPDEAEYWARLGETFLIKQQFRCAEYEYQRAINLTPDWPEYRVQEGFAGDAPARAAAERSLLAGLHAKKGDVYLNWWKYREARAEYEMALAMWPSEDQEGKKEVMSNYDQARQLTGLYPHPEEPNQIDPPCRPK